MQVRDLISKLTELPLDAEVIFPGGHTGSTPSDCVEDVIQVDDAVLSDGSTYPIVMVCHEDHDTD